MSSEKRRRARVQGGWASGQSCPRPKYSSGTGTSHSGSVVPKNTKQTIQQGEGSVSITGPESVLKYPSIQQGFVYEEPKQVRRERPPDKVISDAGVYELSTEPSGVSRIHLFHEFVEKGHADRLLEHFLQELPWQQRSDVRRGVSYLQPRLTVWYGNLPYTYSGLTHEPNRQWTPELLSLKNQLEEVTGLEFNAVLANLYRDGHDSVDWHADDESGLGPQPTVASLSFGATRNFELRQNPPHDQRGDYSLSQHVKVPLSHGSLVIMEGALQDDWQHRIPKEYHDREARVNLTFRVILPELQAH